MNSDIVANKTKTFNVQVAVVNKKAMFNNVNLNRDIKKSVDLESTNMRSTG